MFTRDSALLTLTVVGAIIAYLLAAPPPSEWDYYETLKALAALVAILAAKLSNSPWPSKREKEQDTWDLPRRPLDRD